MNQPSVHICVVCSGNICRSPMARIVLDEQLRRTGLDQHVQVSSAGIGPWHVGEPIDTRAMAALADRGYGGEHIAAEVDARHLDADLFLAADSGHLRVLRNKVADPDRVRLLREFDPDAPPDAEIPDPYYGGERGFDEVLDMIERAAAGIVGWARERV